MAKNLKVDGKAEWAGKSKIKAKCPKCGEHIVLQITPR
jgi:predicted RNA-binding Zn-ribbon protein involved in translation (DUF1610 family)